MNYFHTDERTIHDFSPDFIHEMYEKGYVFTRKGKGVMQRTRSVRIDMSAFELSSENRRILKKTEGLSLTITSLPYTSYDWHIGKLAKDFYTHKFGDNIMSAQKIKEMLTDNEKSNFNALLVYSQIVDSQNIGYCIAYADSMLMHYSYPFYDTETSPKDMGLGMMLRALIYAKEKGMSHVYLGSLQRPGDVYKLQFVGLEWFDGEKWSKDIDTVKSILHSHTS